MRPTTTLPGPVPRFTPRVLAPLVDGYAGIAGERLPLTQASLRGEEIRFALGTANPVGRVDGGALQG